MIKEVNKLKFMTGFVGSRAKKRKRNIFLILGIIIFASIIIFLFPSLETENNEVIPNENIIPDPIEDLTSLLSNVEELELSLFQKDQKIKFRDGQIKNLQTELKNMKSKNETIILELNNIKNISDNKDLISPNKYNSLQESFTKLNIDNDKNISMIKNLNKKISDLDKNFLLANQKIIDVIEENKKLKKDTKSFFAKNLKLINNITDLKNKINEQKIEIELQLEQLKKLKDRSHHGG